MLVVGEAAVVSVFAGLEAVGVIRAEPALVLGGTVELFDPGMGLGAGVPVGAEFLPFDEGAKVGGVELSWSFPVLGVVEELALFVVVGDLDGAGVGFEGCDVEVGDGF